MHHGAVSSSYAPARSPRRHLEAHPREQEGRQSKQQEQVEEGQTRRQVLPHRPIASEFGFCLLFNLKMFCLY